MASLKQRLMEDRATRNAARDLVTTGVGFIKADVADHGVGARAASTSAEYARIITDGAASLAKENRGKLAGGVALALAGITAWIFRKPIMEAIEGFMDDEAADLEFEDIGPSELAANKTSTDTTDISPVTD